MSRQIDSAVGDTSTADGEATSEAAPTIKARDDIDGCGCLHCRNIGTTTINRSVLDALVWSVRLFRSRPSIVAFAGAIILTNRLLETDAIAVVPTPTVSVLEAITGVAFVVVIRAYVGTIVAGDLTDDPVTIREGLHRSVARTPALVGTILLIVFTVMTIPFFVSLPLFVLVGVLPGIPGGIVGFPVAAAVGGIVFGLPFLFLVFKFWFAPEACVLGRYGPLESARVSWRITTNYRRKFVLVAVIVGGSALSLYIPSLLPKVGTVPVALHPALGVVSSSVGELLSIVWAGAYAHIYVQGVSV